MKFGSVPFLARVTPAAPSGGAEIVAVGSRTGHSFGTSINISVPAGAQAGDRLMVFLEMNADNAISSFTDNQSTTYTALNTTGKDASSRQYISAPLGATVPTTITVNFGSGTAVDPSVVYVIRGATGTVANQGSLSSGFSSDPRSHAYTTTNANEFVFGKINFTGGGVTGTTGADGDHTWSTSSVGGYSNFFAMVRPTAGSYGATLGPTGSGSSSAGNWFSLEAA